MSFALLFHYLLLNMLRMLVHPSGSMCVGVTHQHTSNQINTTHEINPQ